MTTNNVLVISAQDVNEDSSAVQFQQTIMELIEEGHKQIIIYFTDVTYCPPSYLQSLLGNLIQQRGSDWFINSGIMIDADNDEIKNQILDFVMNSLETDTPNDTHFEPTMPVVNKSNWQQLPVIKNRVATKEDTEAGNALFYLPPEDGIAKPIDMPLPQTALYYHEDERQIPVIIVQAEEIDNSKIIGMYTVVGESIVGALAEVELIEPEMFFAMLENDAEM